MRENTLTVTKNKKQPLLLGISEILTEMDEPSFSVFKRSSEIQQKKYDIETADILHFLECNGNDYSKKIKAYLESLSTFEKENNSFLFDVYEIFKKISDTQEKRRAIKSIQKAIHSNNSKRNGVTLLDDEENSFYFRDYTPKILDMKEYLNEKKINRS